MKKFVKRAAVVAFSASAMFTSMMAHAGLSWIEQATAQRSEVFNAAGITPDYSTSGAMGGFAGPDSGSIGTTVSLGYLTATTAGPVKYTVLGQESGFANKWHLTVAPFTTLLDTATGASAVASASVGTLAFKFEGDTGLYFANGAAPEPAKSIGLIGQNMTIAGKTYDFVLGYNDSYGSATSFSDWDDMVIGVSMIPEPEIYAMMAAGLGLMGFVARRRQRNGSVA